MLIGSAIAHMFATKNLTNSEVARRCGLASLTPIGEILHSVGTCRVNSVATVADACGYDLLLVGHGETLTVSVAGTALSGMTVGQLIRHFSSESGLSLYKIAIDCGAHSPSVLRNCVKRDNATINLFVNIASVCGYSLLLKDRTGSTVIPIEAGENVSSETAHKAAKAGMTPDQLKEIEYLQSHDLL